MNPSKVKPRKFPSPEILYEDDEFAIAFGNYTHSDGKVYPSLAMRWNGSNDDDDIGYPRQGSYPLWFNVKDVKGQLIEAILKVLVSKHEVLKLLQKRRPHTRG